MGKNAGAEMGSMMEDLAAPIDTMTMKMKTKAHLKALLCVM